MNKAKIVCLVNKAEIYFFYIFLVINLLPVLVFKFFPTVDGPAHLYNSRLILELARQSGPLNDYFIFNEISPNWLGHIILSLSLLIFPANIAEKCLLLIYFIGFPISFRAYIRIRPDHNSTLTYFVFPFTYSFLLFYGFYNFHLGLVFFFWTLYLWVKYNHEFTIKRTFFLLILTTLMCLSHLFVFAVFILIVSISNIRELPDLVNPYKERRKRFLKVLIHQILALSIGLIIMIKFILTNAEESTLPTYINPSALLKWLMQIQPAKGIVYGKEDIFTRWIFITLVLLISYLLYYKIKRFLAAKSKINFLLNFGLRRNFGLIMSIVFLVALFIVPDSHGAAVGLVSSRIILFFFLFLIAWLSTKKFHTWLHILAFVIINYVNIALLDIYYSATKDNNFLAAEISKASREIEPFKTVLPALNSDYWLHGHISNYLGIDRPMVILENYEATLDWFPLKWNSNKIPNLYFGKMSPEEGCLSWVRNINNDIAMIDYVFILNDEQEIISEDCAKKISNALNEDYLEVYKSENNKILVYRLNSNASYTLDR